LSNLLVSPGKLGGRADGPRLGEVRVTKVGANFSGNTEGRVDHD